MILEWEEFGMFKMGYKPPLTGRVGVVGTLTTVVGVAALVVVVHFDFASAAAGTCGSGMGFATAT